MGSATKPWSLYLKSFRATDAGFVSSANYISNCGEGTLRRMQEAMFGA